MIYFVAGMALLALGAGVAVVVASALAFRVLTEGLFGLLKKILPESEPREDSNELCQALSGRRGN